MPFFHTLDASPVIYLSCEQSGFVHRTLNEMLEEYATPQVSSNQILRSYLEILLLKLTRFYTAEDAQYQSPYLLQQVSRYENLVEEHFIRHKSVQEYADMMAFTPKNLNAICKKAVGKTAGSIIKDRVLLEAKRLLMHSELSVNQIVAELNFKDPSYFVRFFRKNEGITPEQFRKRVLNGAYQGEANGLSSPHCAS
jgi:AraC-like DNA-binding protein